MGMSIHGDSEPNWFCVLDVGLHFVSIVSTSNGKAAKEKPASA